MRERVNPNPHTTQLQQMPAINESMVIDLSWKTLWQKEKWLIMNNFSYGLNVSKEVFIYPFPQMTKSATDIFEKIWARI